MNQIRLFGFWLLLVLISLFSRSYIPIDETRYVTVAWNMWLRGDYLVPWLNNAAYSHKPPLLFWLMNAGWAIFGVNEWWPRIVPSIFALGCVFLTQRIAVLLWPYEEKVSELAPWILLSSVLWMVFTTATMFDMMVAFFTLVGMFGILMAWQGKGLTGWLWVGVAIGGGLLAKGPTILLQILPVVFLVPYWSAQKVSWRWYAGIAAAFVLGALIALAWAIPAGLHGGEIYQRAIFWGQTADRMVHSFAHRRPFWWYFPLLPLMLFPWLFWPPLWRGAKQAFAQNDFGVKFCLAWLVPVLLAFSVISGKQVHYLLPIFPAFALLSAYAVTRVEFRFHDRWLPLAATMLIGLILLYLPMYAQTHRVAVWIKHIPAWTGYSLLVTALMMALLNRGTVQQEVNRLCLLSTAVVTVFFYAAVIHTAGQAYDLHPISHRLKALQENGVPIAHIGKYPGQYQFVGRLIEEPEVISLSELSGWFKSHPTGKAIMYFRSYENPSEVNPEFVQPYLAGHVAIINAASVIKSEISDHTEPELTESEGAS